MGHYARPSLDKRYGIAVDDLRFHEHVSLFLNSTFGEGSGLRRSRRGKRQKEARPTAAGLLRRPDVWVRGLPARFNVLASPT